MISRLKRELSILLAALFWLLLFAGLAYFNWDNYRDHLVELRKTARQEINGVRLSDILENPSDALDSDIDYCIFRVVDGGDVALACNNLPYIGEEELYEDARLIAASWGKPVELRRVKYITKQRKKAGRAIFLIGNRQALEECLPAIIGSCILSAAGAALLILLTRLISRRMVRPVEQMLAAEKAFISDAGHELKTPLTIISANAQLLSEEIGGNKKLEYIRLETDRMIAMVGKMLALTRLDSPLGRPAHRRFLADEAIGSVAYPMEGAAFEKKLRMDINLQDGMEIFGDEDQIKNLVSILLDNAIAYTPEGGMISLKAYIHSKHFYLVVENTGEPIPAERRERLFERFYRGDDARVSEAHFGLGLSIAAGIVANHHGKIWADSRDGKNIFSVRLPAGGK